MKLSVHRLDDRSVNELTELPNTSTSNGTILPTTQEAIAANII